MSEYVFYQVGCKRFSAENEDGSGRIKILDEKAERVLETSQHPRAVKVRDLFREVKKALSTPSNTPEEEKC